MSTHVISEEELDATPTQATDPSPSINLGSHLPNPLNPSSKTHKVPSSPSGGGGTNIIQPIKKVPSTMKAGALQTSCGPLSADKTSERRDRINNVSQKEEAMSFAGVTRLRTYQVIVKLLSATKWVSVQDKSGNVREELVDDLDKQRAGAELALKAFGDMIEHKQVEYGIADSTLEKLKALSVGELRNRASAILSGRAKAIDVASGSAAGVAVGSRIGSHVGAEDVVDGEVV